MQYSALNFLTITLTFLFLFYLFFYHHQHCAIITLPISLLHEHFYLNLLCSFSYFLVYTRLSSQHNITVKWFITPRLLQTFILPTFALSRFFIFTLFRFLVLSSSLLAFFFFFFHHSEYFYSPFCDFDILEGDGIPSFIIIRLFSQAASTGFLHLPAVKKHTKKS